MSADAPAFDPSAACASFPPPARRRARRRPTRLLFVEQRGARFVVKSFAEDDDAPGEAERRARRELDGVAAFRAAGAAAVAPVFGPVERLALLVDEAETSVAHAMVFPFVDAPTLYDAVAATADPTPLLVEAGRRIRARHDAATSRDALHSDGSAHNVFVDFTWFDFCEPHASTEIRDCKAFEVLRFVASVVEVSGPGAARPRTAAFCGAYGDRDLVALALDHARMDEPHMRVRAWSRMLGRPDKLFAYLRGDATQFRRVRTWDALDHALRK